MGGDVLSLAPSGTDIIVIGTLTVGVEAPATGTSTKKNSAIRGGTSLWIIGLQALCCVLAFYLH